MTWWQALILGIVEGLTEYIPVSSTGHLVLTAWLLGLDETKASWDAANTFNIVVQSGAILAVVGLYWSRIRQMVQGVLGRNAAGRRLAINLAVAFAPAAIVGPILSERIEEHLFQPWPIVGALFVGAWLMLAVAASRKLSHTETVGAEIDQINWRMALLIGTGQCIAMWPGTSRSMITIVAALMLGLRPRAAAEFSFLLGLPTLTAATVYKLVFDGPEMLASMTHGGQSAVAVVAVGLIASTVSAALAIKWFVGFLNRRGIAPFGWYRLALATLLSILILLNWVSIPDFG